MLNRILRFRLTDEENLVRAFQALDTAGTGYVSPELLEAKLRRMGLPKLMWMVNDVGEPFTQDELEEMLSASVDVQKGAVN